MVAFTVMPRFPDRSEPLPAGAPQQGPEDGSDAVAVGSTLYHLALKYWSEGRTMDAKRVATEALAMLRPDPRGADLVTALDRTLLEIDAELERSN